MSNTDSRDPMRWLWRGVAVAALLGGWGFIAWQNHFHISAPLIVICLGYLAVIVTVMNLWRTGAAAVTEPEDGDDSTWAKPAGVLGELQREKRTLVKAIKEAEFDHEMGKLSQVDVDAMVRTYRARAIDVIKEIERLETGTTGSARDQIMREVRARIELEGKAKPKKAAKAAADATLTPVQLAEQRHARGGAAEAANDEGLDADSTAALEAETAALEAETAALEVDAALDADSTTTREAKRDQPAKEARS